MAYRLDNTPPPKPEDFLPVFDMHNNEKIVWSIPCFYFDQEQPIDWHDYRMHDYLGWPDPHHPGHACQALPDYGSDSFSPASVWTYIDMNKAIPIHLTSSEEAYSSTGVFVFDTKDEDGNNIDLTGLGTPMVTVRSDEDWIVDIVFNPQITQFSGKPKEYLFNVYLQTNDNARKDLLVRGKLVVLPG